jgi:hypothetical protein
MSIWQGYARIETFEPRSFIERRAFQQFLIENKHKKLSFVNRTRLEERWIEGTDAASVRFRHQLKASHPISNDEKWVLAGSDELFFTLRGASNGPDSGFDQNRAAIALGRKISKHVNSEIGYLNAFVNSRDPVANRMLHVITMGLSISFR